MKNIKETIIGVFAVIGFVVIASGFTTNNATQEPTHGTPESHVWEMKLRELPATYFLYNKKTGEVRSYEIINTAAERKALKSGNGNEIIYRSAFKVE